MTDFNQIPTTYSHVPRALSDFDAYLEFETKEQYLAWRAEWREHYEALSATIRALRTEWRAEGSDHAPMLSSNLLRSRAHARSMLQLRHASKRRAQALYAAEKAASAA